MDDIILGMWLYFLGWILYRFGLLFYTRYRPQIVKSGNLYYIRRLANIFQWEYAKNNTRYNYRSEVSFDEHSDVFKIEETILNTSHGHDSLEKAQDFKEKYFIRSKAKKKIERVDGLWFICKNKLSKIKFRRKIK